MKKIIIAHGDGDGIMSAAVLKKQFPEAEIVFTQPFLLGKITIPEEVEEIYVVDIAVDNRNPQQTIDFAQKHKNKIMLWADHHVGGEMLADILGSKFLFDPEMPSCPALLDNAGYSVPTHWRHAANACDRPVEFSPTDLSTLYNKAFKVALVELQDGNRLAVEKVQRQFVNYLITGEIGELKSYAERYAPLLQNTENAVSEMTELLPGVGYIKLANEAVDKTAIFTESYKKFSSVVLQSVSAENSDLVTTVATNTKINLVELFSLKSGAPFRINISSSTGHGETHEIQLEKIKEIFVSLTTG